MVDNIGLPVSSINLTYGNSGTIGSSDADILISLKPDHAPTADYVRTLRQRLPQEFPGTVFGFLPADIVSQILNFGVPAPIDIQVSGASPQESRHRQRTAGLAAARAGTRRPAPRRGVQPAGVARRHRPQPRAAARHQSA